MIFQFKKLFISLLFTVALCCGLSVSALAYTYNLSDFAGSYWSYNNQSTADSTSVGFAVGDFPLSRFFSSYSTNGAVTPRMSITKTESPIISNGDTFYFRYIFPDLDISSDYNRFYFSLKDVSLFGSKSLIIDYNENGDNDFVVTQTGVSSLSYEPIYDGASIVGFTGSAVASTDLHLNNLDLWLYGDFSDKTTDVNIVYSSYDDLIISDSPIVDDPVYNPQISATPASVTSTTFTSQVFLTGLDPSKIYEVYWAIYDTQDNLLGHGLSSQIGKITGVETATGFSRIVNLQPGTTYSFYWHLAENESVLDTTFSNTVTTLGLAPGGSETPGGSGGTGSDFVGEEDDISGSQGDGNTGILMQILNKLSAIFDFLTGDKEVEDTPEQAVKDATSEVTQTVTDNFFGDSAKGQAVTVSDVGNLADTQSTVKTIFQSDYTVTDFFGLFSDSSFFGWFSVETAMDLNPISYGGVSAVDIDDPYNMQAYYENLEKVRGKR